ncbi:MAG: DUF6794 domain-containing protein [Bacteroidota bacterium]
MHHSKIILLVFVSFSCSPITQTNHTSENDSEVQLQALGETDCDSLLNDTQSLKANTLMPVQKVPKDLIESLVSLDSMLSLPMKEWIKCLPDGEFGAYVHFGLGGYLRNSWGLWGNSELAKNLYLMGIFHPDDMSAIILDSYQRKLKGEEIRLDEQIKYYQDFWRESGMPVDSLLNEIEKEIREDSEH